MKAKCYFHVTVTLAFLWCRTKWSLRLYLSFQENMSTHYPVSMCGSMLSFTFSSSLTWHTSTLASSKGPNYCNNHGWFLNNCTASRNTWVHSLWNSNWKTKRKCSLKKPCLLPLAKSFFGKITQPFKVSMHVFLFSSHVQLPADRIPPKSTYLWLAHLVSCSGWMWILCFLLWSTTVSKLLPTCSPQMPCGVFFVCLFFCHDPQPKARKLWAHINFR